MLPANINASAHSARRHSELSASSATRWWNCPGSVRASRGLPDRASVYAAEGTAAHELAQRCLTEDRDADQFIGVVIDEFTVTVQMANAVQVYLDTCHSYMDGCDVHLVEHPFSLEQLGPPVPMFGTADFLAYSRRRRELHVVDLKYGRGVWVAAKNNPQTLYYALGAALAIDEPVSRVSSHIVQPRFSGKSDPVRTATVDAIELTEWSIELVKRAHATQAPDAPTIPGDWCKFCRAKDTCRAYQTAQAQAAYHEFSLGEPQ